VAVCTLHASKTKTLLARLPERIRKKIRVGEKCWEWTAYKDKDGYGIILWNGIARRATRVIYEILKGPIPKGLEPDHLCRNRGCVNPDCIEPVTHRINTLRGNTQGALNARKTQCPKGHPFSESNTYREKGRRRCKICRKADAKRYDQQRFKKQTMMVEGKS
jgi:hypothetical protein